MRYGEIIMVGGLLAVVVAVADRNPLLFLAALTLSLIPVITGMGDDEK